MHIEKVFFLLGLHKKSASLYDYMSLSFGAKHIMPNVMSITRNRNLFSIFVFSIYFLYNLKSYSPSLCLFKKTAEKITFTFCDLNATNVVALVNTFKWKTDSFVVYAIRNASKMKERKRKRPCI